MKILIKENQYKKLLETVTNDVKEHIGDRVMVYYNLHKHTFSVRSNNRVVIHADYVKLVDVEFKVRQGGREKVVQDKQKNVHSFVIGTLVDYCNYPCEDMPSEPNNNIVTYNPYKYNSFVMKDTEESVYKADIVKMINSKNKIFITKQ
jgi:type II secretory pathway component GspD/PulD (secretin)